MPKALFVRADFDLATTYLSAYTAKLIAFAKENGYEVVDLYDDNATFPARLAKFELEIEKKPDIFIGCGHGNTDIFTGQDLELLIKKGINDDACSSVKTYLWSCLTARQLGPALVSNTCPQYYGYREDFTFVFHPDFENNPLEDPYARAFFDSGLATGYALLLGKSPQEVYQATIDRYTYWWDYWLKQDDPMADDILTWIHWNRDNFMAIVPGETFETPPEVPSLVSVILPLGVAGVILLLMSQRG